MKVYKICTKMSGWGDGKPTYESAALSSADKSCVTYKLGKFVKANRGCNKALFTFDTIENAKAIGFQGVLFSAVGKGPEKDFLQMYRGTKCFRKVKLLEILEVLK